MIKAILFDFDGVLTIDKTGSGPITRYIAAKTGIPLEEVKETYYSYNEDLLMGRTTHEENWEELCKRLKHQIPFSLLQEAFLATRLDEDMVSYLQELKEKYKIAMVTDNKCDRIEAVVKHHNLMNFRSSIVFTY